MQLNKTHKRKIVRAIMQDIPQVSYKALIRDYVQAEAVALMPPEVKAVYDNEELRRYLCCVDLQAHGIYSGHCGSIFWHRNGSEASRYSPTLYLTRRHYNSPSDALTEKLLKKVGPKVAEYCRLSEEQGKARKSMEERLESMLEGIRTLKQAKTLLEPELHKYLPEEPPKAEQKAAQASTALVPYVVAHLKEMGWPKDKEAA